MAARPIGSATISFGLVSIPVKLYSTVDSTRTIRFNYLSDDGEQVSRVRQQYIRATDGEVVQRSELIQGYEFTKGQYVTFTAEELKALHVEATNAIEIAEFIPLSDVERIYIDHVYYLGPDTGAARSYHLLKQALQTTGRAALANFAKRGRSHLVLVRPMGDGLVLEQLKYQDELRTFEDVPLDSVEVAEGELDLAIQIIEQRTNEAFEPDRFEDAVRAHMLDLIQRKVEGKEVSVAPEERPETKIIDLMEALKASVSADGDAKPAKRAARRTGAAADGAGGETKTRRRAKTAKA
ncbi:MAG: Ku protein [Gammaproteobacteria bacterium]|nr:Ku protein [Gammaproteobacteria bacterium]